MHLQNVLGFTVRGKNSLACDPTSGVLAYPAGCVIVLLNLKSKIKTFVQNPEQQPIECLDLSTDGQLIATGEVSTIPYTFTYTLKDIIAIALLERL